MSSILSNQQSTPSNHLTKILQKTKHLSKQCNLSLEPYRQVASDPEQQATIILSSLDEVIKQVISLRGVEDEYMKLEEIVQKLESQLRKHVGTEMQLKLYGESLQQQLEESEAVRSQFLESTRVMLADYKRRNQELGEENRMIRKLTSQANTRTLRYSLTKGQIIRNSQEATSSKTRNKKIDLKEIASRRYLKTQHNRQGSRGNLHQQQSTSIPKNLEEVKVGGLHKEFQTDRAKKMRYAEKPESNPKNQIFLNSSYNHLYEPRGEEYRNSYIHKKVPKRRSLKKSSLSCRVDESQELQTVPKNLKEVS